MSVSVANRPDVQRDPPPARPGVPPGRQTKINSFQGYRPLGLGSAGGGSSPALPDVGWGSLRAVKQNTPTAALRARFPPLRGGASAIQLDRSPLNNGLSVTGLPSLCNQSAFLQRLPG